MYLRFLLVTFAVVWAASLAMAAPLRVDAESSPPDLIEAVEAALATEFVADTPFAALREARRAADLAREYLNTRGYFDPEITASTDPSDPLTPVLTIAVGQQYSLAAISIDTGDTRFPAEVEEALAQGLALQPGEVALPDKIIAQEAGLVATLRQLGYADARAMERNVIGNRTAATLTVTYRLVPGPRVRFGRVVFPNDTRTRRKQLNYLVPFKPGDVYRPDLLAAFNTRLQSTRLYTQASAQLAPQADTTDSQDTVTRDVHVILKERPRYTLSAGASVSTDEGPGATIGLVRRNASRRGDTLSGRLTLAQLERSLRVEWAIPHAFAYERGLSITSELTEEETDAFDREAMTLQGQLNIRESAKRTYALAATSEFTRENDAFGQRDLQILSVSAGVRLDHSDNALDPTRGWRADARIEPAVAMGDTPSQFFTLNGQIAGYYPLESQAHLVAAARVRQGFVFGADIDSLPVSRRFFAGGGGSARGFEYQSVGPEDTEGTPTGGRGIIEVSGELRWRSDRPLGFVAFVDGATVSRNEVAKLSDIRFAAGLGARYDTPVGPIRFDIATPIDREPGDDPVQIYIAIGQAF